MASVRGLNLTKLHQIRIAFSMFDNKSSAAREILRRVSSQKMIESNPKCKIITDVNNNISQPFVEVTFSDGSTLIFDAVKSNALKMVTQINVKARTL